MELTNYLSSMQFVPGMLFTLVIWRNAVNYIYLIIDQDSWLLASSRSNRWNSIQQTWRMTAYEKISKFVSLNCFCFFFDNSLDSRCVIFLRHIVLVYTKTVDSVFRALWLATQSVNILHYSLIHLQLGLYTFCSEKRLFCSKELPPKKAILLEIMLQKYYYARIMLL